MGIQRKRGTIKQRKKNRKRLELKKKGDERPFQDQIAREAWELDHSKRTRFLKASSVEV